ncbi:MAG: redox-regulated ATPase YchF [bacterium]
MELGIVGLPNAGKSTLFNALTVGHASVSSYPFCTIDPNVGVVEVPDQRLEKLEALYEPQKLTHATIKFIDIAGLVKGASKGEGLGNKFLSHIREVDGIVHVVRCFLDENVSHVETVLDPLRDAELIDTELMLADLQSVEKDMASISKKAKSGDKDAKKALHELEKISCHLQEGKPLRGLDSVDESLRQQFVTAKPVLLVANTGDIEKYTSEDKKLHQEYLESLKGYALKTKAELVNICAQIENEIVCLPVQEQDGFRCEMGVDESGLESVIISGYRLLGLITFFTIVGEKEIKAWTIREGTMALDAAGKVHSDMKKGFIRADVFNWSDLISAGSGEEAHNRGLVRSEGKTYRIKDGDIVRFKFNV